MKKKLMALILGSVISLQGICSGGIVINAEDSGASSADRVVQIEYDEFVRPIKVELYQGEQIQLDFGDISEDYDTENIIYKPVNNKVVISNDGVMVGCDIGEDEVSISVDHKTEYTQLLYKLSVNILPNDLISDENLAEIERLNGLGENDYRRRKMELLGVADENAPRLAMEKVQGFIDSSESYGGILNRINNYVGYPDDVQRGPLSYTYWFDEKGNESITYIHGSVRESIVYTKIADDGTVIGSQDLYPEKSEFLENGVNKNQDYMQYNQINPIVEGVLYIEDYSFYDEPMQIELYEGEQIQLKFSDKFELNDKQHIRFSSTEYVAAVTQDLRLIGGDIGEEVISIYFEDGWVDLKVTVKQNDAISAENRAEIDRLNGISSEGDYYIRRKMELRGVIDEDAPRLNMEKVEEFINLSESFEEIVRKCDEYHGFADLYPYGSADTRGYYWFDEKGNEQICYRVEEGQIFYVKIDDNGTLVGYQELYPEKSEYLESNDIKNKDYYYMCYNQKYGKINVNLIDTHTGEPFTEINGKFQLIAKPLEGDDEEFVYKEWWTTNNGMRTLIHLPKDYSYRIVYNEEYQTDENGIVYKYEVANDNGYKLSINDEISVNVFMRKQFSPDQPNAIAGDINLDGVFGIADVAVVQKWLLGGSFYGSDIQFDYWHLADFCDDDKLDVFDLCLMKEKLLENGESAELPTLEEISKMSDEEVTELFSKYTFKEIWCIWGEFDWGFSGLYGGGWVVGDKEISLVFNYYTDELESARIGTIPK